MTVAALSWIVAHWLWKFPMKRACREIVTMGDELVDDPRTTDMTPSAIRPTWLGEAASFLTMVAIRAAQNHAAYCLGDWIAPRRVARATKTRSQHRPPCAGLEDTAPEHAEVSRERIGEESASAKSYKLSEPARALGNAIRLGVFVDD